jgi:hypothetical protein
VPVPAQVPAAAPQEQTPPVPELKPNRPTPPPLPRPAPDVRMPGETGWWIDVNGWFPTQKPSSDRGHGATYTAASIVQFQGKPKVAQGVDAGIAIGLHNTLRFTYEGSRASGLTGPLAVDSQFFGQTYAAGTVLTTDYKMQMFRLSFDYLTWPYPVESRHFRLKTLYQVQYLNFTSGFDAPYLPLTDSSGNPLTDASGNLLSYATTASKWFVSPLLGLGVSQYYGRHLRLEANASGFDIPHHNNTWNADASANVRYGHFELSVGGKGFHFQTSRQADVYFRSTTFGVFAGIRWYSD